MSSLILASASPRRRELLREAGYDPVVRPSGVEERAWPNEKPESYALRLAWEKALEVAERQRGPDVVLGADTIVVLDDLILEKPADEGEAVSMLTRLSGQTHTVMTGFSLIRFANGRLHAVGEVARTRVRFRNVTEEEIRAYVATGEPMDKAGAYAIQGGAADMVAEIDGSYTNVVGLPLERVTARLTQAGIGPADGFF